ncbi:MAG: GtrA family protein [Nocardioides sp.]|nr:GtrA family protein [Nocardioides sp.]
MASGGGLLHRLRHTRLIGEALRFMAVGGIATTVAFVLFNLFLHGLFFTHAWMPNHPITAYVIANTVGMLISYDLSRRWTFAHRSSNHPDGGFTAYTVINVVTMVLPVACLWLSRHVLGLSDPISDNVSANVVGVTLGQAARFYLFRRFVFARPERYKEMYDAIDAVEERLNRGRIVVEERLEKLARPAPSASAIDSAKRDRAR